MDIIIVDVSGSMELPCGNGSRLDLAISKAYELCTDSTEIWATAGSDASKTHTTAKITYRGDLLDRAIRRACKDFGGGGAFIDQAIKYISHYSVKPIRLYIITDEAINVDCKFYKESLNIINVVDICR